MEPKKCPSTQLISILLLVDDIPFICGWLRFSSTRSFLLGGGVEIRVVGALVIIVVFIFCLNFTFHMGLPTYKSLYDNYQSYIHVHTYYIYNYIYVPSRCTRDTQRLLLLAVVSGIEHLTVCTAMCYLCFAAYTFWSIIV